MRCLLIFLLWITVVFGVFVENDGGHGGRGKSYDSSSSSWSSESHEGHGHHHHENRPRPSRPRPSRPRPPPRKRCDDGWMAFDRPQGMWCVKVFGISVNADTAQSLCAAQGAKLTGVQNAKERLMIAVCHLACNYFLQWTEHNIRQVAATGVIIIVHTDH
ncbi:hypothetical protein B9Z55_003643 [Caenorhabditis nigoni]|uniref:C-type lectin domain-containing protein n=1 Tax=Caenorhabditis nigoni TaxID=1611254 RepID=A0A2G5VRH9_9PELO|nr:hypothetical protein B9Z55_003643 [Caenorhabditis nigoni]